MIYGLLVNFCDFKYWILYVLGLYVTNPAMVWLLQLGHVMVWCYPPPYTSIITQTRLSWLYTEIYTGQYWIFRLSLAFHCLQLTFFRDFSLNDEQVTTEYVCLEKIQCWWNRHSCIDLIWVMAGFAHLLLCEGMFSSDKPLSDGFYVKRMQSGWAKEASNL